MKDLIVVVADKYQEKVIEALLPRIPVSSGTSVFSYDLIQNILRDSGSYNVSHELLRPYIREYRHAIILFDYEGSGIEHTRTREEAEGDVEGKLTNNGWKDRNSAIAIYPELENWMWIDNPNVEQAIGWESVESLYTWARVNGLIAHGDAKPIRPKESLEKALRISSTSKSAAIYKKISETVSYRKCQDPSLIKLIQKITEWFPI